MNRIVILVIALLLACAGCRPAPAPEMRVLFVGNSLTYVGNVPAVYAALATANGHPTHSDMIVRGGATLSQRVADGSVARALADGDYAVLVLQERGGDLMCGFGPDACEESRDAIAALVALATKHGTRTVLLGTYQPGPAASKRLVDAESAAAQAAGITYVEISETLAGLRTRHPDLAWFDADGMHPGRELALLNAVKLHRAIHGEPAAPAALSVVAPIYAPRSGLQESLRAADAPPPLPDTPARADYPREILQILLAPGA